MTRFIKIEQAACRRVESNATSYAQRGASGHAPDLRFRLRAHNMRARGPNHRLQCHSAHSRLAHSFPTRVFLVCHDITTDITLLKADTTMPRDTSSFTNEPKHAWGAAAVWRQRKLHPLMTQRLPLDAHHVRRGSAPRQSLCSHESNLSVTFNTQYVTKQ